MTESTRTYVEKFLDLADLFLRDRTTFSASDCLDAAETSQSLAHAAGDPDAHEGYLDAAYRELTSCYPRVPHAESRRRASIYRGMSNAYANAVSWPRSMG